MIGYIATLITVAVWSPMLVWLGVSVAAFLADDPIWFQRAGALGVAAVVLVFGIRRWAAERFTDETNKGEAQALLHSTYWFELRYLILATLQSGYGDLLKETLTARFN